MSLTCLQMSGSGFLQVSEFLLDTKTGEQAAKVLANHLLVKAEVGSVENKVRNVNICCNQTIA